MAEERNGGAMADVDVDVYGWWDCVYRGKQA